nr:facilitated trehalose transporter Tret1-like [Leptinotarsa decemlineata]
MEASNCMGGKIVTENHSVQILAVIFASLSAITCGIGFSWSSPFVLKISKDKQNYDISEEQAAHFTMLPFLVVMVVCPIFSKLSDVYGRKRILLVTSLVDVTVWILKATARSVYVFYIARLLVGVSEAIMFVALPAYLGEVSSPKIRGTWGNSMTVSFLLGELLVTVAGSYFNVWETSCIFIPIPVLFFILFSFMPESPYFYIMRGRYDEAKMSLQRLNRKKDVTADFSSLKADVDRQMSEHGTWKETLKIDSNRRALAAALFLRVSHIVGGGHAFVNFTQYIFDKSEGTFTTEVSSMIFMSLVVSLSIFASLGVNWLSRRKAYMGSLIPCAAVLFIEAVYFYIHQHRPDVNINSFHWIPIVGMILYSIFSSYGINLMPTLMLGELFSTSFRLKAMSIFLVITGIVSFIANALFYFLSSKYGLYAPFLFFSICDVISSIVCYFILPETKDRTLEEIQQLMKGNESKKSTDENENLMCFDGN